MPIRWREVRAIADYSLDGLMYLPTSHLRRGDIYMQMGDKTKAIEHYSKFVGMWSDADPDVHQLRTNVERRLAQLNRE